VREDGKNYAKGIVPGFIFTLEFGGSVYTYHTDKEDTVKLSNKSPVS
jgi:hypothetical protein